MLKALRHRSWICRQCLQRQRLLQTFCKNLSFITSAADGRRASVSPSIPVDHSASGTRQDDKSLRLVFDSPSFWNNFTSRGSSIAGKTTGLIQNHHLTRPSGFRDFAQVTLQKCRKIVKKLLRASTVEEYIHMAKDLDRVSDLLCRVIDLSDFIRVVHPDRQMQTAATQAYALMFEYMNILNTTTDLHKQLEKALSNPEVTCHWTPEERTVATILMKDFSRSAIHMPPEHRQRFVDLSNDISNIGTDFVDSMEPAQSSLVFDSGRLKGMDPLIVEKLSSRGKVTLPTVGPVAGLAVRTIEDEDVRRDIYLASRTPSRSQIDRLENLLTKRMELAQLAGYDNFAQMSLSDKMAKTPEAVQNFLEALATDNRPLVQKELRELRRLKKMDMTAGHDSFEGIRAWDRDYYTTRMLSRFRSTNQHSDFLSSYFSLGSVMQGLSRLFSRLYGVRFVAREIQPGETWNSDVRRLDVISETDGRIAVIYCDLFEREGKNPNPAHFTLRCSRKISQDEIQEAIASGIPSASDMTPSEAANDGMPVNITHRGEVYQIPTIALICDFPRPPSPHRLYPGASVRPVLLSFYEVRTLFHEMGHAMHSILGRTALQNVSGTRCATDFAELPSILTEHFCANPAVLKLFARHFETGDALPFELVKEKLERDKLGQGSETEAQILMALQDQAFHTISSGGPGFDSTKLYHDIYQRYASVPEPPSTAWHGFFGHLYGYGATYYAYLFDRAIAGKVWRDVFMKDGENGVIDRAKGEKMKDEVLKWGGGRSGWECVGGILGDDEIKQGGESAMKKVGEWGARD